MSRSGCRRGRGRGRGRDRRDATDGWEDQGGYMQAKKQKLQDQFVSRDLKKGEEVEVTDIFHGVSIYVNGYTKPSSDELKYLMSRHGGRYEHYMYRTRVTHVIATNLPDSKVQQLRGLKVVKPEWITDSVKAGHLLPYIPYQLYTAQTTLQPGLKSSLSVTRQNSATSVSSVQSCSTSEKNLDENQFDEQSRDITVTSHNLSDQHSPSKAGDPNFLNDFYGNSRLHHLSTWKTEYKEYVAKLQRNKGGDYPGRDKLRQTHNKKLSPSEDICSSGKARRVIMHIDMDCFFVSVGLKKRPELKGKPVAVTHSRGRGVSKPTPGSDLKFEMTQWHLRRNKSGSKNKKTEGVSPEFDTELRENSIDGVHEKQAEESETFHSMAEIASCSYEARNAGVKNGMLMGTAKQLCPDLVTIPYDFEGYKEVSVSLYDTVASYTHDIEAVSCDEMLIDCTDVLADTGASPLQFSSLLRKEIYEQTGCTASAGMGPNILLAKMCTRQAKPNGEFHLSSDGVQDFIKKQSIKDIPGVGWSMTKKLNDLGISFCGDLQKIPLHGLQKEFGPKTGQSLYKYCRGEDYRPVKMDHERKSVSAEINYGIRFTKESEAEKFLTELSEEVQSRLGVAKKRGKTITLKLMVRRADAPKETAKFMGHGICTNISKSVTLPTATDDPILISRECFVLLKQLAVQVSDLRGIGIQVQKLESVSLKPASKRGNQTILDFAVKPSKAADNSLLSPANDSRRNNFIPWSSMDVSPEDRLTDAADLRDILECEPNGEDENHFFLQNTEHQDDLDDYAFKSPAAFVMDELKRKKTAKRILPPLPALPTFGTPPESSEHHTVGSKDTGSMSSCDYFPSPSQIDPNVLQELPKDVRDQIESEIKTRRASRASDHIVQVSPGCSHWSERVNTRQNEKKSTNDSVTTDRIQSLPSPSQLDMSCFNALPDDLQKELKAAYASTKPVHKSVTTNRKTSLPKKSPSKGKKSPQFKVPHGKPGRGRPKKLDFQQPEMENALKRTQVQSDILQNQEIVNAQAADIVEILPVVSGPSVSNLCGAVHITDVRMLIKEWLSSTTEPEVEDEEVILNYIQNLILDLNLEQVDLVIKCLYRNIKKLENFNWWKVLQKVVEKSQNIIQSIYGAELKLSFQVPNIPII